MNCLTAGRLERSHVAPGRWGFKGKKWCFFALASTNPCINLNQLVLHGVSSQCHLLSESEIVPVHCVLYVCCSDSVRWIKLERLCTAVAFLDLECPNCQPFPRPLTAPRTWPVCYMNVIFICAAVADEALAPSQIHVAVLRCWWFPRSTQSEHWRCFPSDMAALRRCPMLSDVVSFIFGNVLCSNSTARPCSTWSHFWGQLRRKTDEAGWYGSHVICRGPLSSTSQGDITVPGRNFTWIKSICQRLCSISSIVCLNCGLRWKSLQRSTSRELKHGYPTNSS